MSKKIHLTRDSVRPVSAEELSQVRGGAFVEEPKRKTTAKKKVA